MPNYCDNDLYFEGSSEDVEAFIKLVSGRDGLDFAAIIQPQYADSADCRRECWGTASRGLHPEYRHRVITFQTAWSPPLPIVAALHKRFPEMSFSLEYFEMGMGFCGGVNYDSREQASEADAVGWEPGKPAEEWHLTGYRGRRGG